jgi:hypothetical protein
MNDTSLPALPKPRSLRGFAAMSPEKQKEIAGLGGRAAHLSGHAHEWSSEEARQAGKKRHARIQNPDKVVNASIEAAPAS